MSFGFVSSPVNWVLGFQTLKGDSLDLSCFFREITNQLILSCLCPCKVVRETYISKGKKANSHHRGYAFTRPMN